MRILILCLGTIFMVACGESGNKEAPTPQETTTASESIRGRFMRTIEYENGDTLISTLTLDEPNYQVKEYLYVYGDLNRANFRQYSGNFQFEDKTYLTELVYSTCEPDAETLFYHGNSFKIGETDEGILRVVNNDIFLDFERVDSFTPFLDLMGNTNFYEDINCNVIN